MQTKILWTGTLDHLDCDVEAGIDTTSSATSSAKAEAIASGDLRAMLAAGMSPEKVADELGLDYDEQTDSVVEDGWIADDGNQEVEYEHASSAAEAAQEYVDGGDWGESDGSIAITVLCWRRGWNADGEEVGVDESSHLIVAHPEEPACDASSSGTHEWSDAHELVGGDKSNPGIWSAGGCSIRAHSVCVFCGVAWTEESASQGEDTEHDHASISYSSSPDDGAATTDELARYHQGELPDAIDLGSDAGRTLSRACVAYRAARKLGDTTHESAEEMYAQYGAHISTADAGDISVQAVDYADAADMKSATAAAGDALSEDEREELAALAVRVRDDMDSIESLLDEVVAAWERGDAKAATAALREAKSAESEHGDWPATRALAEQLLGSARLVRALLS